MTNIGEENILLPGGCYHPPIGPLDDDPKDLLDNPARARMRLHRMGAVGSYPYRRGGDRKNGGTPPEICLDSECAVVYF
jgi:hypothetical protein